jgi:hypothetical protein
MMGWLSRTTERAPCTVEVSHCFDSLHAHVRFDNGTTVFPGDSVQVEGPEIMAPYGTVVRESREAVIRRASGLERLWTRWTGDLEVMELCEFSFSDEVTP